MPGVFEKRRNPRLRLDVGGCDDCDLSSPHTQPGAAALKESFHSTPSIPSQGTYFHTRKEKKLLEAHASLVQYKYLVYE